MWRSIAVAGFLYGAGQPSLESVLPDNLNFALDSFHREINQVAAQGYYAFSNGDIAGKIELCASYVKARLTFNK